MYSYYNRRMCSVSNQIRMPIKKQDSCTTSHNAINNIYTLDCVEHHFYFRSNTPYSSIVGPSCCKQLFIVLDIQKINIVSKIISCGLLMHLGDICYSSAILTVSTVKFIFIKSIFWVWSHCR